MEIPGSFSSCDFSCDSIYFLLLSFQIPEIVIALFNNDNNLTPFIMKKALIFLLAIFILNQPGLPQFKSGYIVTNENDTIKGFINFEGSIVNSDRCEFRLPAGGESQVFKPGDIQAFRFDDSKLFSTWDLNVGDQQKKVFIEWLMKGRASLLTYTGNVPDVRYFLLAEDGTFTELTNTTYQFSNESQGGFIKEYERKKQEYVNTLLFYFRDYPPLDPQIKATQFNSKSLMRITKTYHEKTCPSYDCIVYEQAGRKMTIDWGIYAAYNYSIWKINNGVPENVYPLSVAGLGLALDISNLPSLPPKFRARVGLGFSSITYKYDTLGIYPLIDDDKILKLTNARVPLQIAYRFSESKISPYLSGGLTVNLRFGYRQYDRHLTDFVTQSMRGSAYDGKVSPIQFGLNFGPGMDFEASPRLRFNFGYDLEYCRRMYGTNPDDHSYNLNHIIYIRTYFKRK
jgi:hypothetical protein